MSSKRKTRVMISFEDEPRELYAIEELSDRGLIIRTKPEQRFRNHPSGREEEINQDRFSVHVSPKSPGTTIKHTQIVANAPDTSVLFVENSKETLLVAVEAKIWPLLGPRYSSSGRASDVYESIGKLAALDVATLVTVLVVADAAHQLPDVEGFSVWSKAFSVFKVGVYSSYLNVGPSNISGLSRSITFRKEVRIPDQVALKRGRIVEMQPSEFGHGGVPSTPDDELRDALFELFSVCLSGLCDAIASVQPPMVAKLLRSYKYRLHASPAALAQARALFNEAPFPLPLVWPI